MGLRAAANRLAARGRAPAARLAVRPAVAAALAASLAACAVGPNYHRPAPPKAPDYGSAPSKGETVASPGTGGAAQTFVPGADIPAEW